MVNAKLNSTKSKARFYVKIFTKSGLLFFKLLHFHQIAY